MREAEAGRDHRARHPPSHRTASLTVRGLTVTIGGIAVLDGVDLDVLPGGLHVILGPSGAGKSSIVSTLTGTLPARAGVTGQARLTLAPEAAGTEPVTAQVGTSPAETVPPWGGETFDLLHGSARERRQVAGRLLGAALQGADSAFSPTMTIRAQLQQARFPQTRHRQGWSPGARGRLAFGLAHPHRSATPDQHLQELAAAAGLDPEALGRHPHQLSGGQLSRLNLLAAMVNHPPVLVADEPTTGLDRDSADTVGAMLSHYARSGHTVLVVTHDEGFAHRWAHHVTRVRAGRTHPGHPVPDPAPGPVPPDGPRSTGAVLAACRAVTVRHGQQDVLAPTDLEIRSGELIGLTGPSGVGKSSLAALLALLRPPEQGHLELQGRAVHGAGLALSPAIRRQIGWISQHPQQAVDRRSRLRDLITLPARLAGLPVDDTALAELARSLGLDPALLERRPHQVSGGQLQRACVARALALQPRVVIADEPFSMVDGDRADLVLRRLDQAARDGAGILVISHDVDRLETYCDRVLHLHPGPSGAVLREAVRPAEGPDAGISPGSVSPATPDRNTPETPPA